MSSLAVGNDMTRALEASSMHLSAKTARKASKRPPHMERAASNRVSTFETKD
jgi:hypothetical protein